MLKNFLLIILVALFMGVGTPAALAMTGGRDLDGAWSIAIFAPTERTGASVSSVSGGLTISRSFGSVNEIFSPLQHMVRSTQGRASAAHVGAVMTLLATFDEAAVLPPEHDPRANQLIHTLIQLQSVVMKSLSLQVHTWVLNALTVKYGGEARTIQVRLQNRGLTMEALEALIDYADTHSPWDRTELAEGFHAYNVQQKDWMFLRTILLEARDRLQERGENLATVFDRRRSEMPGAGD